MVHIIDDLERQGLAERRRNENDRRSHSVRITPAGLERLAAAEATMDATMDELLAPLSTSERRQLHDLLDRFIAHAADGSGRRTQRQQ
jgi:DNA-binding MarR family transcriptional regulator